MLYACIDPRSTTPVYVNMPVPWSVWVYILCVPTSSDPQHRSPAPATGHLPAQPDPGMSVLPFVHRGQSLIALFQGLAIKRLVDLVQRSSHDEHEKTTVPSPRHPGWAPAFGWGPATRRNAWSSCGSPGWGSPGVQHVNQSSVGLGED